MCSPSSEEAEEEEEEEEELPSTPISASANASTKHPTVNNLVSALSGLKKIKLDSSLIDNDLLIAATKRKRIDDSLKISCGGRFTLINVHSK